MKLKWSHWIYTLLKTVIGGVAATGSAWLGTLVGNQVDTAIPVLQFNQLWSVLLSSTLLNLFFFLKQSPLPEDEDASPSSRLPVWLLTVFLSFGLLLSTTGCVLFKAKPAKVAANISDVNKITVEAALRAWNDYIPVGHPSLKQQEQVRDAWQKYKASQLLILDVAIMVQQENSAQTQEALNLAIAEASKSLTDLVNLLRNFKVNI